jgi:calcineurin-like phosphoesterase family protein
MPNTFIVSDHHFGHAKTTDGTFKHKSGANLRPFKDVDEMNYVLISRHNAVVSPSDTVIFLGDVVINKKFLPCVLEMNGRKKLVQGNHDLHHKGVNLGDYFEKVCSMYELSDMILTHIAINAHCVDRFKTNVHGHSHDMFIPDPRFLCVSVEHTNYTPLSLDEIRARIAENHEHFKNTGNVIDFSARYV